LPYGSPSILGTPVIIQLVFKKLSITESHLVYTVENLFENYFLVQKTKREI
jgi:hypothetical protein